eukprot:1203903-Pyramimonas_sp.AAC.1
MEISLYISFRSPSVQFRSIAAIAARSGSSLLGGVSKNHSNRKGKDVTMLALRFSQLAAAARVVETASLGAVSEKSSLSPSGGVPIRSKRGRQRSGSRRAGSSK